MDEKQKTNIQRIAQGLPPLKESHTPANWLPQVERRATRRMIKQTARRFADQAAAETRRRRRRAILLIAVPSLAVLSCAAIVLWPSLPREEKLERRTERPPADPALAAPEADKVAPDGSSYRRRRYQTGNIEVELPRRQQAPPPPPPDTPYQSGFQRLPAGMSAEELRQKDR